MGACHQQGSADLGEGFKLLWYNQWPLVRRPSLVCSDAVPLPGLLLQTWHCCRPARPPGCARPWACPSAATRGRTSPPCSPQTMQVRAAAASGHGVGEPAAHACAAGGGPQFGCCAGRRCGCCTLAKPPRPPSFTSTAVYLSNMAVDAKLRRRGLARKMLAAAEALVASAGQREIYLHVRLADAPAQQLYTSSGFEVLTRDNALLAKVGPAGGSARHLGEERCRGLRVAGSGRSQVVVRLVVHADARTLTQR